MTTKTLLNPCSIKSLRKVLENKLLPVLQQSPILVVTSEASVTGGAPVSAVSESSQMAQFMLAQQFGLRTVPATISSAFPSVQDLETKGELLRRTGASSIVAVGSGAAIDLAKALAAEKKDIEQLILIPSTHAAVLAAGASHSLLLDSIEETLVPFPTTIGSSAASADVACPTIVAPLDSKYIAPMDSTIVLYASLAIVLDACLRRSCHPVLEEMLQQMHQLILESPDRVLSHDLVMRLLFQSGDLLSYGLSNEDRSSPMALAASLIPRIFPHVHILTFWASLVPGLCRAIEDSSAASASSSQAKDLVKMLQQSTWSGVPRLTVMDESMKGFSVPDMAVSHIQSNQTVWKSFDMPTSTLTEILQHSMNRH